MPRVSGFEITEHDQLVVMMARYFQQEGFTNIKADIPGWTRPDPIYWSNRPENKFIPDLTCLDAAGITIILEAETCNTFSDQHTREQFEIFRAHSSNINGRFEVVVPRLCSASDGRQAINAVARSWGIVLDNVWTPSN